MRCSFGKDYGLATGQCFSVLEKIMAWRQEMLCNIGKYNDKATGQCSAVLEKIIVSQQDNALQYWKIGW
jgi:hypothetical protein